MGRSISDHACRPLRIALQPLLLTTLMFALPQLSACSGCSSYPTRFTQAIDAPTSVPPGALLSPAARASTPLPGQGVSCVDDSECDDGNPCTEDRCIDATCHLALLPLDICCQATPLLALAFDDLAAPEFAADPPLGGSGWGLSSARAVSAPSSLTFGDPSTGTLGGAQRVVGAAWMPPVTLPEDADIRLSMRLFVDIEANPYEELLALHVDVLDESATVVDHQVLLRKEDIPAEAYAGFALLELSLSEFAGQTVQLRLDFDSVTAPNPNSEGVFLDDLEIATLCPEPAPGFELPTPAEDPLVEETAPEGSEATPSEPPASEEAPQAPPQEPGGALISGGPASEDPCDAPDAHEGCCTSDAECDDGDPATINVCEGAECVATWNPDACAVDADCGDDDPCTLDACQDSLCVHEGTFGAVCCEAGSQPLADFDTESLQGLFVTDNLETGVFWRTDPTRSTSGGFSLYCGEPVAQTYAIGQRVKSSATTPILSLPAGGHTRLTFDLFMVTRPALDVDVFQVFALRAGALVPLWSSKALSAGNTMGFTSVQVDLSSFAGQDLQLRFVFDSVDAHAPANEGTYIDTLRLETTCF